MALTSCCGWLDLRRGSLAIGIAHFIVSALGILLTIIFLAIGPAILLRPLLPGKVDFGTAVALLFAINALLWIALIMSVLMLIASALLIYGVQTASECLVLTWMILHGIMLTLSTIGNLYQLIATISNGFTVPIVLAVLSLLWVGVQWYWYAVVVFFYRSMGSAGEPARKVGSARVEPLANSVSGSIEP